VYQLRINNSVQKQFDRISLKEVKRITTKLLILRDNPRPSGCKKLHDENGYRIRIGVYRVLYEIDDKKKIVTIYKIAHRKDVYR